MSLLLAPIPGVRQCATERPPAARGASRGAQRGHGSSGVSDAGRRGCTSQPCLPRFVPKRPAQAGLSSPRGWGEGEVCSARRCEREPVLGASCAGRGNGCSVTGLLVNGEVFLFKK